MKVFGWRRRLTPFDRKLTAILAICVFISFLLPLRQGIGARVLVERDGKVIYTADLDHDQQVELQGPLGVTVLQIEDHAARVISSPCPQKICIGLGKAKHSGDLLACVPNRLVIRIEGDEEKERGYDLLSR
ncbi:hypothetical protein SAMN02745165_02566 [Malonomonas rubra DSM 5091]|uniref:Uncharacterized protein n=1 Tax=Malonomonas rubra DSM 5091 TaxID=1122189 RepID=A0A1M6JYK6_MALRU|nr:NusG domain II-containing protein [Malonomonas rubra]SHJ51712.1 hypothetical protein SAMN02745165_02566 [Malonomonas rubra DSM 5091]